jgi:UPF0755 protein
VVLLAASLLPLTAVVGLLAVYPHIERAGDGASVRVSFVDAVGPREVAERLHEAGVVDHPRLFAIYLRFIAPEAVPREAELLLPNDLSPAALAIRVLEGFGEFEVRVVIPEGLNRYEIAKRLADAGASDYDLFLETTEDRALLLELGIDAPSAEGFLFPDTYRFRSNSNPRQVVRRMVRTFHLKTGPLFERHGATIARLESEDAMSLHDLVKLASIVEKEAAVRDERARIAGVFWNRLRSETFRPQRRLQADPTVSYGCIAARESAPSCHDYAGRITRAMLEDRENQYNTYRHAGLPPTPIANPGLGSLEAVLLPEQHDYLFFVAKGKGKHHFSVDLVTHEKAIDRYIRGK